MKYAIAISGLFLIVAGILFFNRDSETGRGNSRTGFSLYPGEQIGIGTSTLAYDFEIVSHSTSTIKLGKDNTATTTGGCLIVDDYDKTGSTYCIYNDGIQTCSSTDICH